MKRDDLVSILVTFVVGIFVGVYIYLYGYAPQFSAVTEWVEESGELVLTGEAYGGCERGGICASFNIASDGTYRAFPTVADREARQRQDGEISSALWREVRRTLTEDQLFALAEPVSPGNCASERNGVDYRIRVTYEDVQYQLDTCSTALANDDVALTLLDQLRDAMRI